MHFTDRLATKVEINEETRRAVVRMRTPADRVRKGQGMKLWVQRKKKLLKATATMRLHMAIAFAEKNIDRQLTRLHRDLLEIWSSDKPPHTRRGLIFETWDDCEDSLVVPLGDASGKAPSLDELRLRAGTRARAKVIAFIRRHLPAGSPDAFTARELVAMNERRNSRERFAPYDVR